MYETESYRPESGAQRARDSWGWGASGGVSVAAGWLVVRSTLTHAATRDRALSMQGNDPTFSVHAGVRF